MMLIRTAVEDVVYLMSTLWPIFGAVLRLDRAQERRRDTRVCVHRALNSCLTIAFFEFFALAFFVLHVLDVRGRRLLEGVLSAG